MKVQSPKPDTAENSTTIPPMTKRFSRRETLKSGAALAALAAAGIPDWLLPALAQGEEVVPWTDVPSTFNPVTSNGRSLDTRTLQRSSFITPTDEFYAVQHYNRPAIDSGAYRLRVTGLVEKPVELTIDALKRRPRVDLVAGFECSGNNSPRLNMQMGNARWTGTSLRALLEEAHLKPAGREVVFLGADAGTEEIVHGRDEPQKYDQTFARSLAVDDAMRPEVLIAWEMNGAPLPLGHGAPVRLIVPGWYGIANVKWLTSIHVQDSRLMGRFMARDYVTLTQAAIGDRAVWIETSVSRMRLKSMVARLTRIGDKYTALGVALHDGTPLRSVEVRVDDGPWRAAALDRLNTQYSWKLFTHEWTGLAPGEHTIVSRVTDANGAVQPDEAELRSKKTRWENNGQFPRRFVVGAPGGQTR